MCGKRRLALSVLLSVFVIVCVGAQQPKEELNNLSLSINEELVNLRQEINSLNNDLTRSIGQLNALSSSLKMSNEERELWKTKSTELSTSLENISVSLNNSYGKITELKTRLSVHKRVTIALGIIFGVLIIIKVVGFILYAKGIKLPRWIDIIV